MTDAARTNPEGGAADREPEMISGTTGLGNDINTSPSGLSGSIASGTPSGPASDTGSFNDWTTVSGGPDMSGMMGGTGGMDADHIHILGSGAMDIDGTTSIDTDAAVGRDTGMSADASESAVDTEDGGDTLLP